MTPLTLSDIILAGWGNCLRNFNSSAKRWRELSDKFAKAGLTSEARQAANYALELENAIGE
jgi:hypothetical protein